MKKNFRVHDYFENEKARISIFILKGKVDIWWDDLRNVKYVVEKEFSWRKNKKYFWDIYLFGRYYDSKFKEFHEHKLGRLTDNERTDIFLDFLRYFPYIIDAKLTIQRFLSGLLQAYQDRIEFNERKTLEDTI